MLRPPSRSDKLDGRIRDIDRELRELQKAMRELSRTGRTDYVPPVPRARRPAPASAAATRESAAPVAETPAAPPPAARDTAVPVPAPLEYFETGTGETAGGGPEPAPLPYPPWRRTPGPAPGPASEPAVTDDKRRFASYFSSGFLPGRPLKGERHTQRNRAIAMFVVVVVLAYILYRVVR